MRLARLIQEGMQRSSKSNLSVGEIFGDLIEKSFKKNDLQIFGQNDLKNKNENVNGLLGSQVVKLKHQTLSCAAPTSLPSYRFRFPARSSRTQNSYKTWNTFQWVCHLSLFLLCFSVTMLLILSLSQRLDFYSFLFKNKNV